MGSLAKSLYLLYRFKDHVGFTIPLVILGVSTGAMAEGVLPHLSTIAILLAANILAISFAFAINEVEDWQDDKHDPHHNNPISKKLISRKTAILEALSAALISLILFSLINSAATTIGLTIIILSFLYSFKPIRLKSKPWLDLLSHSLMLSGLIFASSYISLSERIDVALPPLAAVILFSVYGQFYNQIRDFKEDKRVKIKNTTILLGVESAKSLAYSSILIGIALLIYTFYKQIFPLFLVPLSIALVPLMIYFDGYLDARDARTKVLTGSLHKGIHIVATIISLAFLGSLYI